jgi:hypothetical protein
MPENKMDNQLIEAHDQMHLFSLSGCVGNTLIDYDLIPKFLHDRAQKRIPVDQATGDRRICVHKNENYYISPALIKDRYGDLMTIYPGTRESLVEECLLGFTKNGEFSLENGRPGYRLIRGAINVYFTLYQLLVALKARGKEYNTAELDEALAVLHKSTYRFQNHQEGVSDNGAKRRREMNDNRHYINSYTTIDNEAPNDTLRADKIVRVTLSEEATERILEGGYRSYDVKRSLEMKSPIARHLYKKLTQNWLNANDKGESGSFLELMQNESILGSGYPLSSNVTKRRAAFTRALNELSTVGILEGINVSADLRQIKQGRKIIDLACVIRPTKQFIKQQITGHSRYKKSVALGASVKNAQSQQHISIDNNY